MKGSFHLLQRNGGSFHQASKALGLGADGLFSVGMVASEVVDDKGDKGKDGSTAQDNRLLRDWQIDIVLSTFKVHLRLLIQKATC